MRVARSVAVNSRVLRQSNVRRALGAGLAASLVMAMGIAAATPVAAADLTSVRVGIPGHSIGFAPWFVGKDAGIFAKNGMDVTFAFLAGNALPAALISNGIQATPLLSEVINANFAGYKIKAVGLITRKAPYMIVAQAAIKSVADLKGKAIVTSPPKGLPNVLLRYFLAKNKLNPDTDAHLIFIGSESARRTLILAHRADAIVEDAAYGLELEQKMPSLHTLVAPSEMPDQSSGGGLGVSEQMLQTNPGLVKRMLVGLAETMDYMRAHPNRTAAILAKETKLPLGIAKSAAAVVVADMPKSLVPSEQLFEDDARVQEIVWGSHVTAAQFKSAWDTRLAADVEKSRAGK